ncbi:fumarylacetoacetate hydrolase family protein [Sphingomonas sp. CLY1604]|uniref:fumarylacetoacetate hydrolase family protein n=1 Tax=Sphingomonas sp. CLY1604 TaxID=3457786 RepID=UPI003FD77D43
MRLATIDDGTRDGALVVVSRDGARMMSASETAPTLQRALESWSGAEPALRALFSRLEAGQGVAVGTATFAAPLPRAWQWLDGSAFPNHGVLMQKAFDLPALPAGRPLMYQGLSHRFLSGAEDVPLPSEDDGIDFEGEFGVIVDDVPMGCPADEALDHVKLVVMINDWSLRSIAPIEMRTGFGWVQAKPACSMAPFAVTPEMLGDVWRDGRVHLPLVVEVNGERFGSPDGSEMAYGFHELIAHAARTRDLPAGTVIGSGTVSNEEHAIVGSTCISERRAIEMIETGGPLTPFLAFGARVSMRAGDASPFGSLDQRVVVRPI